MLKPDLVQEEVPVPENRWCSSGHAPPEEWEREGPGKPKQPMKFFKVTGHGVNAVFCEACLVIARWAAAERKKGAVP